MFIKANLWYHISRLTERNKEVLSWHYSHVRNAAMRFPTGHSPVPVADIPYPLSLHPLFGAIPPSRQKKSENAENSPTVTEASKN